MRNKLVAVAAAVLALSGCGGDPKETTAEPTATAGSSSPAAGPSETEASSAPTTSAPVENEATTIDVSINGDKITPNGDRVEVAAGEPVIFKVTSDRAGEFHVHSTPEQTPAFTEGTSTVEVTIDTPGVVDVEEHESGIVIAQLEVR